MKKLVLILVAAMLALSLAACGENDKPAVSNPSNNQSTSNTSKPAESSNPTESSKPDQEPSDEPNKDQASAKSALELLTKVWSSYKDDDKFPAAGGDMSEENMTMDAPGKFGLSDTAALDTTLGFPASSAEKIDDAASLVHMMNANTFTCGAFHVKDAGTSADVSAAIKANIMERQWICGFPDKLVIVKIDDYIVAFFGENEIVDTFKTNLTAAYTSAETICDEPIA